VSRGKRSWKEKPETEGNHERCDGCWPPNGEDWIGDESGEVGRGPERRW
jgi:hypothetical protein